MVTGMVVLVTGATGFLGAEVARLLLGAGHEVLALVRAPDQRAARERLDAVWTERYGHGMDDEPGLLAVPGDVTQPGLGLDRLAHARLRREVTHIVHSAASVSFEQSIVDALQSNTVGTQHVLDTARELRADGVLERLLHVSTAYVAGRCTGRFGEGELERSQAFRNTYERSKYEAECLLAEAPEVPVVVARPSIIVGDSRSGWTPSFNTIYGPLRAFDRGLLSIVPADAEGLLDIVPVDYVAGSLHTLLDAPEAHGTYHLVAGRRASTIGEVVDLACRTLRRARPRRAEPDEAMERAIRVQAPYFDVRVAFGDERARGLLGREGLEAPALRGYFGALMGYARATRWGRSALTRAQADELTQRVAA